MKHAVSTLMVGIALISTSNVDAKITPVTTTAGVSENLLAASSNREPQGLRAAAELGLRSVINDLTKDLKTGSIPNDFPFDVNDLSELKNAKLSFSFEVHTVQPQTLLAGGRPLEQMLTGTGIWNFVVSVNNAPIALLEMEKSYGKWVVNGVGGAKLAQDVQAAAQNHSAKDAFRFVRIYQATADFMEVKDSDNRARYVPLIAARETLKMAPAPASNSASLALSADILPTLQNAVRGNIARLPR